MKNKIGVICLTDVNKLLRAKHSRNDEYYTKYEDIVVEMDYLLKNVSLKDKVVYCNCDDYKWSNFVKYFMDNFEALGLKRLISTCVVSEFGEFAVRMDYDGVLMKTTELPMCFGEFDSIECEQILDEADWVITNPPFSLFRRYIDTLLYHNVDFLILGSNMAVTYGGVFRYILDGKVHAFKHADRLDCSMLFVAPDGKDHKVAVCWYSSVDYKQKPVIDSSGVFYNELDYMSVDSETIMVNCIRDIPCDYRGVMLVPITLLMGYDTSQYEILNVVRHLRVEERNIFNRIAIKWR